jgi:hypothetical protein
VCVCKHEAECEHSVQTERCGAQRTSVGSCVSVSLMTETRALPGVVCVCKHEAECEHSVQADSCAAQRTSAMHEPNRARCSYWQYVLHSH